MAFDHRFSAGTLTVFFLLMLPAMEGGRALPASDRKTAANTEFIRSSCGAARFPELCFSSLSSYASTIKSSPKLLVSTALNISLDGARAASAEIRAMNKPARMSRREGDAVSECVENVGDSIDELRQSIGEMADLGRRRDVGFQINSIQTWISAALTDDDTCMDDFAAKAMDGSLKTSVRGRVANLAHLTSNALSLVNALASTLHSDP